MHDLGDARSLAFCLSLAGFFLTSAARLQWPTYWHDVLDQLVRWR